MRQDKSWLEILKKQRRYRYVSGRVNSSWSFARGSTQKELAQRLSVTQTYVSKIERQEKITPKRLASVNSVLSWPPNFIMGA